jgi:ubiquinone/menaquinone biosynthesis C-methylase UbiE
LPGARAFNEAVPAEARIPLRRADCTARPAFTGERFVPGLGGTRIAHEHLHRYAFARRLLAGRRVLDLGCGLGYGAELWHRCARDVVSLDHDAETIANARAMRTHALGPFLIADACRLPLASASFDAVVAFELIEHVSEQQELIAEIRRVLRPTGLLLLSSPDTLVYSGKLGERNPFHIREMTTDELRALVAPHFAHAVVYKQRAVASSVLVADPAAAPEAAEVLVARLDADPPALVLNPSDADFVYNVLVCGPRDALEQAPGVSVLADVAEASWHEFQSAYDPGGASSAAPAPPPSLRRAEYKEVWQSLSTSEEMAKLNALGCTDESEFGRTAQLTSRMLLDTVGVNPGDTVLEIGAGVGRVGEVLAPLCREWIGADVSENMLRHIGQRIGHLPNIRTVLLSGYDLAPIPSESVDLVYCTVVFMHLTEWERYGYIREGLRVLRAGGRMLADSFNLLSEQGWALFERMTLYHPADRPPQISAASTPQEIETYFHRAGFVEVRQRTADMWIVTYGRKPAAAPA